MQRHAKELQTKSRTHQITSLAAGVYEVTSGASGETYRVTVNDHGATCTCNWAKYRPTTDPRSACSHTIAVYNYRAQQQKRRAYAWHDEERARRQHKKLTGIGDGILVTTSKA